MSENVEAIVLSTLSYKDSDKIFLLFTKEKGIISVIAKGVRKHNSKRSYSLDTLNLVRCLVHLSNNYYFIQDAILVNNFNVIKKSINFLSFAFFIIEATVNLVPAETINTKIFLSLLDTLQKLNTHPTKRTIYNYLIVLLKDSGVWSDTFLLQNTFLQYLDSGTASDADQLRIDLFLTSKIEEAGDKRLKSKLILAKL